MSKSFWGWVAVVLVLGGIWYWRSQQHLAASGRELDQTLGHARRP